MVHYVIIKYFYIASCCSASVHSWDTIPSSVQPARFLWRINEYLTVYSINQNIVSLLENVWKRCIVITWKPAVNHVLYLSITYNFIFFAIRLYLLHVITIVSALAFDRFTNRHTKRNAAKMKVYVHFTDAYKYVCVSVCS